VSKGIIDMRALFVAMRGVGYDGWVGVEDFSTEKPLRERLTGNLEYLKVLERETR
jgi:sugar phosphate isomerase/epimerase